MPNRFIIELDETNFDQEVLGAETPVLVEFWAAWSRSCMAMTPILDSMAEGFVAPVKVVRVNVDSSETLTKRCGVRSVPTLLIFNQGGLRDQIIGPTTEQAVRESLECFTSNYRSNRSRQQLKPDSMDL